jgi:hypothetical protein
VECGLECRWFLGNAEQLEKMGETPEKHLSRERSAVHINGVNYVYAWAGITAMCSIWETPASKPGLPTPILDSPAKLG